VTTAANPIEKPEKLRRSGEKCKNKSQQMQKSERYVRSIQKTFLSTRYTSGDRLIFVFGELIFIIANNRLLAELLEPLPADL
jgi:hypothetical protein